MIRKVSNSQSVALLGVVDDAAQAYKGLIPVDCWKEPYMTTQELKEELDRGLKFYGWYKDGTLVAVMGIQRVKDVTLIRHAYVLTRRQRRGLGEKLLKHLLSLARTNEVLVGTWEAAHWAIRFYEKNCFKLVSKAEKDRLLQKYWNIPKRQIETSVVLKLKKEN